MNAYLFKLTKNILLKISLPEYSLIINKHNQKLVTILENQKIYGGSLKILSGTHLQSIYTPFTHLQSKWVLESETPNISILRKPL